jgi:L-aspartate oxidase
MGWNALDSLADRAGRFTLRNEDETDVVRTSLTTDPTTVTMPRSSLEADFLVIGSGVAGLRAALDLCRVGRVIVLTKGHPLQSNSIFAQGGVAVALSEEDDVAIHMTDTVKAGHGLCRREAVRVLVEEGPDRIQELIRWGAKFDKTGGKFAFAREAAHSRSRILRARGDATGNEMVRVLMTQATRHKGIVRLDYHFTVDLVVEEGRCCGAVVLDEYSGEQFIIPAKAVVLSRAGAELQDMEFVQFHPTSLYLPSSPPFLLSEAMRGEGGQLRNNRGETFMSRYHPLGALAPRDIVARAIWAEMAATRARHVYLDVTHLGASFVKRRFPTIYATCLRHDIDITEEWIPVSPSAHYMMGGVATDINGATTLPGLFAAGEVACSGVHGANRLASNSLLEGLVFGMRAGVAAVAWISRRSMPDLTHHVERLRRGRLERLEDAEKVRSSLRRTMWGQVGLVRSRESLVRATAQLARWEQMVSRSFAGRGDLEVKNMVQVAHCVAEAALWRENSVGAHYRSDFPGSKRPGWKQHSQLRSGARTTGQTESKTQGRVVALRTPKRG